MTIKNVYQKPDGRWYISYRDEAGKQRTKVFGRGDDAKKEAMAAAKRMQADRILGQKPEAPKPAASKIYFAALAQEYIDDRRTHGASDSYIQEFINLNNNHIGPRLNKKPVNDLTYTDVMAVIKECFGQRKLATRQRRLGYLKAVFRFGIRHKYTTNNPLDTWEKRKEEPRRSMLTVEDILKIHSAAPEHLKWAIELQWNLGTRPGPSELLALKWTDVDFDKGKIAVYASKTKSLRTVPVSPQFLAKLRTRQAQAETQYLIEYRGKPVHKFRSSFRTACRVAGITFPCRMYDLRHMFASIMLSGGADLAAVSKLLGHSTTYETATTYYDLLEGEKERAVSLLPSIFDDQTQTPEPEEGQSVRRANDNVIPFVARAAR